MTLAILAGGQGTRLGGVEKGLLELDGRPLLQRLLELAGLFADVLLVTNNASPYVRFPVRCVSDVVRERGAPGGVHAALAAARTPWVLAVACDMPFVTAAAVECLVRERRDGLDAVMFERDGRPEPLLALYSARLKQDWEASLSPGQSFAALLAAMGASIARLPEAKLRAVDPSLKSLVSVNWPEDMQAHGITWIP